MRLKPFKRQQLPDIVPLLQIGRAYVLESATAKVKVAYQDFLTLWKDADPDIPNLATLSASAEVSRVSTTPVRL